MKRDQGHGYGFDMVRVPKRKIELYIDYEQSKGCFLEVNFPLQTIHWDYM